MKSYIMNRKQQTKFDRIVEAAGIDSIEHRQVLLRLVEQYGREKVISKLNEMTDRVFVLNPLKWLIVNLKSK